MKTKIRVTRRRRLRWRERYSVWLGLGYGVYVFLPLSREESLSNLTIVGVLAVLFTVFADLTEACRR